MTIEREVRKRLACLSPLEEFIIRARYLRTSPLSRCDTAKLLKQKGWGRFRGAKAVTHLEEGALLKLKRLLRYLLDQEQDPAPPTIWEETIRNLHEGQDR
jgi:hypothetical protein